MKVALLHSTARRSGRVTAAFLFLSPALVAITFFFFVPVVAAFLMSFTDFDIYALGDFGHMRFVGLKNYGHLIEDPLFWKALKNTLYFVLVGGPLSVAVSLVAALLVHTRLVRWKGFFRLVYFIPVVTTLVAVAVVWRAIYHPRFGLLNYALGFVGIDAIDWLGDPVWAMPAIILLAVWKNFGFNMIIFLAGLQSIPGELYEAARIDGATPFNQFRNVTLPLLAPTSLFVGIITMIGYFQLFAEPYVMTQGGPSYATLSIILLMYQHGFRWWSMGYSTAIAFVLFALVFVVTMIQLRMQKGFNE